MKNSCKTSPNFFRDLPFRLTDKYMYSHTIESAFRIINTQLSFTFNILFNTIFIKVRQCSKEVAVNEFGKCFFTRSVQLSSPRKPSCTDRQHSSRPHRVSQQVLDMLELSCFSCILHGWKRHPIYEDLPVTHPLVQEYIV